MQLGLNLCLAAASVVGTVALTEGGARYLAVQVPFSLYPSPLNCLQRSALLSLEFRPNCTGSLAATRFQTNAAGFRGGEIRDDGSTRILAIGDSCTWGWRVGDDESYPARLQQMLDHRWGEGNYQVLNQGVPGHTSYQGLQFLRARGVSLRPQVVIAGYGFNDASGGGDVADLIARQAKVLPILQLDDWLVYHSEAYHWARWRLAGQQEKSEERRVTLDDYVRNLTEIVKVARAHGAAVVFVGFSAGLKYGGARTQVAADLHVPLIQYRGQKIDVVHPTAEGYRDLAADILDRLTVEDLLALPARGPS